MTTFENVRSLDEAFVYATEVALAQLSDIAMLKKTSQSRLERQRTLCLGMLKICTSTLLNAKVVDWGQERHHNFPRVMEMMSHSVIGTNGMGMDQALKAYVAKFKGGASSAGATTTIPAPALA